MKTYSLRWRIAWPLLAVLALAMTAVVVGMLFYLKDVVTNSRAVDEYVLPHLRRRLDRRGEKKLDSDIVVRRSSAILLAEAARSRCKSAKAT
jgi:hypothetical protein